jgi:hypothetical protein
VEDLWYSNKAQLAGRTNLGIASWDSMAQEYSTGLYKASVRVTTLRYITGIWLLGEIYILIFIFKSRLPCGSVESSFIKTIKVIA